MSNPTKLSVAILDFMAKIVDKVLYEIKKLGGLYRESRG